MARFAGSSLMHHQGDDGGEGQGQPDHPQRGLTVPQLAARYRVGKDTVRTWIRSGQLAAINTAAVLCGKPRWVVLPEALVKFEQARSTVPPPKPAPRRRRTEVPDYFPGD